MYCIKFILLVLEKTLTKRHSYNRLYDCNVNIVITTIIDNWSPIQIYIIKGSTIIDIKKQN